MLFDPDGTLVDSVYKHVTAWARALKDEGILLPKWKIHRHVGMSGESFVKEVLREERIAIRENAIARMEKKHARYFARSTQRIQILPGARSLLKHLSKTGIRWAIATSGERKQVKGLLQPLHIPKNVPIITGDDVDRAKPSPDVFLLAAKSLGVSPGESIIVGDSPWDVLAAVRTKALGVGLLCGGYSKEELWQAGAFRVYEDPADLFLHMEDLGIPGEQH
jgi:HAD superfamily hydrolase (TIGR01509 family)